MAEEKEKKTKENKTKEKKAKEKKKSGGLSVVVKILFATFFILLTVMVVYLAKALTGREEEALKLRTERLVGNFYTMKDEGRNIKDSYLQTEKISALIIYDAEGNRIAASTEDLPSQLKVPDSYLLEKSKKNKTEIQIFSTIGFNYELSDYYYYIRFEDKGYVDKVAAIKMFRDSLICLFVSFYLLVMWFYTHVLQLKLQLNHNEDLMVLGSASRRLAHEIKNPLSAILMQVTLLEKTNPEIADNLQIIKNEGKRVLELTDRIREFMSNPVGEAEAINIVDFINDEARYFNPGIITINSYIADMTAFVFFDKIRLRSIITNVIKNAIEAQAGMPKPSVTINITSANQNRRIKVDVLDCGTGIRDCDKDKIFNPFYTTKNVGTGIGLSITKQFLSARGGSIELRNRYDGENNILGAICTIMFERQTES